MYIGTEGKVHDVVPMKPHHKQNTDEPNFGGAKKTACK
jgi:hypothetical protein